MPNPDTDALRKLVEVERVVTFWGQKHRITPRLVSRVIGDGGQLIWLAPIDTRPNYYVARIDSMHTLSNFDNPGTDAWLDDLYDLIADEYGEVGSDDEWDGGEDPCFPVFHSQDGCSWGPDTIDYYTSTEGQLSMPKNCQIESDENEQPHV